jgi:hypothetical protein
VSVAGVVGGAQAETLLHQSGIQPEGIGGDEVSNLGGSFGRSGNTTSKGNMKGREGVEMSSSVGRSENAVTPNKQTNKQTNSRTKQTNKQVKNTRH